MDQLYDFIGRFVAGLLSNPVSEVFTWIIVGYFSISAVANLFAHSNRVCYGVAGSAPQVLTMTGILGTFTGIFLGLLDFDVNTINRSVPTLLEGLKVAFATSILGLFGALIFRSLRFFIFAAFQRNTDESDVGREILSALQKNAQISEEGFTTLRKALAGDDDGSVTGQLQRMRASFTDLERTTEQGFNRQIEEFQKFAEHMSKAFSEAIIEELKSVIREFNEKISEQFGENFKQLNFAVGRLVDWQDNYKHQLEDSQTKLDETMNVFNQALEGIQQTEQVLSKISESASFIPASMERFDSAVKKLNDELIELHKGLASVVEMRERAENAFPEISDKIDELTETLTATASAQQETISQVNEEIQETVSTMSEQMTESVKKIEEQINASLEDQQNIQKQMLDEVRDAFNKTVSDTQEALANAINTLDESMQEEVGRVIQQMADNLSGITRQFVEDYAPLLEQSRQVVELSKQASSDRG